MYNTRRVGQYQLVQHVEHEQFSGLLFKTRTDKIRFETRLETFSIVISTRFIIVQQGILSARRPTPKRSTYGSNKYVVGRVSRCLTMSFITRRTPSTPNGI